MTITDSLLKVRTELEDNLRNLLGIPVYLIELDAFALPCGCSGATINIRGFTVDDIEVFEEHILKFLEEATLKLEIQPSFLFARLIPGTAEVASLNARMLCDRCYRDFARGEGKQPRPDIYVLKLEKNK